MTHDELCALPFAVCVLTTTTTHDDHPWLWPHGHNNNNNSHHHCSPLSCCPVVAHMFQPWWKWAPCHIDSSPCLQKQAKSCSVWTWQPTLMQMSQIPSFPITSSCAAHLQTSTSNLLYPPYHWHHLLRYYFSFWFSCVLYTAVHWCKPASTFTPTLALTITCIRLHMFTWTPLHVCGHAIDVRWQIALHTCSCSFLLATSCDNLLRQCLLACICPFSPHFHIAVLTLSLSHCTLSFWCSWRGWRLG
jgi:hypothetical protein